ncbi:hypothetical protein CL633_00860 [bacterium]|nr:hypothetical protein [bacterium]|tara:strand:+ start:9655 stop:10257 length:603 start_codon:yes stop_codon:yes gene_type:complete
MKIGIDARIIYYKGNKQKSRIGMCVYNLLKCLVKYDKRNQYVLFCDSRVPHEKLEKYVSKKISIKYFPFSQYRKFIRQAYSQFLVSAFLTKERLDIFHACAGTMPLIYPGKSILTLYKIETKKAARALQKKICKKAKKIVVPSKNFKNKLCKTYKINSEKVETLAACTIHKSFKHKPCAEQILRIYKEIVQSKKKKKKKK